MNEELRERLQELLKRTNDVLQLPVTCPKCHGKGKYEAYEWDEEIKCVKYPKTAECELCKGTGKITLQFYEDLQKGCRR